MKRLVLLTITMLVFGAASLAADHQGKGKKHQAASEQAGVSWSTHDIEIVRHYYAPKRHDLPPGLEKKYARTGQLPPGWQKKMEALPASVERECAPLPSGYRRGVIEGHAVIYNSHGTIIDVAVVF